MKKIIKLVIFLLLWQGFALIIGKAMFPGPDRIIMAFFECSVSLLTHSGYSLYRIFAGVFISLVFGIPIGILTGYYDKFDKMLTPYLYLLNPIPKIALSPIIMMVFGIGEVSKIFIIVIIMIFQIILSVRDGIRSIPYEYFIPYYTIKADTKWIVKDILIPASLANIFTSLRIGLATGISVLFFTETFGTKYGMGYFIMDMWLRLDYSKMYLGMLWLGGIGFLLVKSVDLLESRLFKWKI